jgi:hypothetical protein
MPALPPYIPPKDADFNNWVNNFSTVFSATPAVFGFQAGDATAVAGQVALWNAAYGLVTSPSTKTPSTVSDKNASRIVTQALVRPYAQTISLSPAVSQMNKISIGVNPRTSTPIPIAAPTTYPALTIVSALPLQHVIRYRDSLASPSVKSKPYGVVQMQLYGSASGTPITNPALLAFQMVSTKSPFLQTWDSSTVGQRAYYAARWVTRRGLNGPWSPIVSFIIAN